MPYCICYQTVKKLKEELKARQLAACGKKSDLVAAFEESDRCYAAEETGESSSLDIELEQNELRIRHS